MRNAPLLYGAFSYDRTSTNNLITKSQFLRWYTWQSYKSNSQTYRYNKTSPHKYVAFIDVYVSKRLHISISDLFQLLQITYNNLIENYLFDYLNINQILQTSFLILYFVIYINRWHLCNKYANDTLTGKR